MRRLRSAQINHLLLLMFQINGLYPFNSAADIDCHEICDFFLELSYIAPNTNKWHKLGQLSRVYKSLHVVDYAINYR